MFFSKRKNYSVEKIKVWNEISVDEKKERIINTLIDLKQLRAYDEKICLMIDRALSEINPLEGKELEQYIDEVSKVFGFN